MTAEERERDRRREKTHIRLRTARLIPDVVGFAKGVKADHQASPKRSSCSELLMAFLTLWTPPPPNVIKKRPNSSSKNRTENKSLAKHNYLFEFASHKDDLNKRQTLTPVSLLLKPNISIWQLLICSPSSSSSSFFFFLPLPLIYFSLTVLAAQSQIDVSLSTLALPSPKEGEEGGCVCFFLEIFITKL